MRESPLIPKCMHPSFATCRNLLLFAFLAALVAGCGGGTGVVTPPPNQNPLPTLTSVNPTTVLAGGPGFTLTAIGTGYIAASVVNWNGSARPTTFASATQLTAQISAADIATAGTANITVFNPTPGGGTSGARTVTIQDPTPPLPPPSVTVITAHEDLPGVNFEVLEVTGGSGPGGSFLPGDSFSFTFHMTQDDGTEIPIEDLYYARAYVSGPTFNYQRILARVNDVREGSYQNAADAPTYTYTFAAPIPSTYLAPYNDSPLLGLDDGELQGLPLMDGTYTLGIEGQRRFSVEGTTYRDVGNVVFDFLVGNAPTIEHREVVKDENCYACHDRIWFHGGNRVSTQNCVLCHTAGAEDDSGTGLTVEFKVMMHKIHNGAHLPSFLGVTTNPNGSRNYNATPKPYEVSGHGYSGIYFPVWPNFSEPMPRDAGYGSAPMTNATRAQEDEIRRGVTACLKCHGDPDGEGADSAPAQGGLYASNPTRRVCGSCHDDVVWTNSYSANNTAMGPQTNDDDCTQCHDGPGSPLPTAAVHVHPLWDPAINPGLHFNVTDVSAANLTPTIDPLEKVSMTFTIKYDDGTDVNLADLDRVELVIGGPTTNYNRLLLVQFPISELVGPQPWTLNVPEVISYEYLGDAVGPTDGPYDHYTDRAPIYSSADAEPTVWLSTGAVSSATLQANAWPLENYLELPGPLPLPPSPAVPFVRIDGGSANEEYARVGWVDGTRLWLAYGTSLRFQHANGAPVQIVGCEEQEFGVDYGLTPAADGIMELGTGFPAGSAIIISYTTDFVMPAAYPIAENESPDLYEIDGKWKGKTIVDGTYTLGIWGELDLYVTVGAEDADTTNYNLISEAGKKDFLVGSATSIKPYNLISSAENCAACHEDIRFHGAHRQGFEACIMCHGMAGAEDWAEYRNAGAGAAGPTPGVTINFRDMLHKIHMGEDLAKADEYVVAGYNGGSHKYDEVVFPVWPEGVRKCSKCHGTSNAWQEPSNRDHPTQQVMPTLSWTISCGSCHDSDAAAAHMELKTTLSGEESCGICHGSGAAFDVELMHKVR